MAALQGATELNGIPPLSAGGLGVGVKSDGDHAAASQPKSIRGRAEMARAYEAFEWDEILGAKLKETRDLRWRAAREVWVGKGGPVLRSICSRTVSWETVPFSGRVHLNGDMESVVVTVSSEGMAVLWKSQAVQYPKRAAPGILYLHPSAGIHCLLFYGPDRKLQGILNYYSRAFPPFEIAGNINLWVRPDCLRQGIGTQLLQAAMARWPLDFAQQRYTAEGLALVRAVLRRRRQQTDSRLASTRR
jgi:GNAT superfamily N-acetyltransferase